MKRDEWTTPPKLFDWLNRKSGCRFTIDAAASKSNALCKRFYTKKDNALDMLLHSDERYFCNPPYSLDHEFARHFLRRYTNCVMLLPVRSDRLWFQEMIHRFRTCWITGRLHFGNSGKGAFMYSILIISGFKDISFPLHTSAAKFNANGRGGATY